MNTTNLPTPPRSKNTPEHAPQDPNIQAPNQPMPMQLPPAQPAYPAPVRNSEGDYPPPTPRYRVPYLPGPTLEDERRALEAKNNLAVSAKKNALRPCPPVIRGPAMGESIYKSAIYEHPPVPESPYKFTLQSAPQRRPLLEAWRARMGLDEPARTTVPSVSRGGVLSTMILDQIVVFLLLDAPHETRPRDTLKSFVLACRRFRNVAAPYVYQHVILRGNGDAGVYARTGTCKFVRSLTIQFEPHEPWNPYSVLMDPRLYPTPLYTAGQIQETGVEYFFPNITQIAFVAKVAHEEARYRWIVNAALYPELSPGNSGPYNRSKLYRNPAFLAMKLVQLVPMKVKTVTLDADIPGLLSKFAVTFMTRPGNPNDEARLDLVTRREEVVQATEFAIHSHTPAPADPIPARTTIVMYGPSYGTSIVWDGNNPGFPVQTVWRRHDEPNKPALPEEVLPPTWEELGPGPRRSTRKSTSPYKNPMPAEDGSSPTRKRGELLSMVKSAGKTPMYAKDRAHPREPSPEPEVEPAPETPKEPVPTPEPIGMSIDQQCAWSAGRTVAEFPNAISAAFEQVNDLTLRVIGEIPSLSLEAEDAEYTEFWRFASQLADRIDHIGVWHTAGRTEVDTFIMAFRQKRYGANMRALKFEMMHEKRGDEVVMEREIGIADLERAKERIAARNEANASGASSSASSSGGNSSTAGSSSDGRVVKRVRIA